MAAIEAILEEIAAGKAKAPPGPVHVVGHDVLVQAVEEIKALRKALQEKEEHGRPDQGTTDFREVHESSEPNAL